MALKPIGPSVQREHLGVLGMWRDDIAEVLALMAEVSPDQRVELQTDKYKPDNIDDLGEAPESTLRHLTAIADGGRVRLHCVPGRPRLKCTTPTFGLMASFGRSLMWLADADSHTGRR